MWSDGGRGSSQRKPASGEGQEALLLPTAGSGHCFGRHRSPWLLWGTQASPQHGGGDPRECPKTTSTPRDHGRGRLGCHGYFHHLLLVTLGQPGSSVGEQRAVSTQGGGTHGDWLAGGGGHRGLPSPRGPRQGTEVSLPGQPWRCPSGSPGKQKQNGSGSPGDQLSSSFSANPSLTVNAPTTHPKCSLLGRPGEGVPSEGGTPPRLGSPQINSSNPTSTASHHCWHCCCFSRQLDKSAWGCGRRWRRGFQVGLHSQEASEATCD